MKPIVHVANTDFEFELASGSSGSVEEAWSIHSPCLQLQFLPILYASADDTIAVTRMPDREYLDSILGTGLFPDGLPTFKLLGDSDSFKGSSCVSWGSSSRVFEWARSVEADYPMFVDPKIVSEVNSKAYSFSRYRLPGARLVCSGDEFKRWQMSCNGPKVLKTCFGVSGRGNRIFDDSTDLRKIFSFCEREWKAGRPLIGEPLVDRIVDFSTQWEVENDGKIVYLGATLFETDSFGSYRATLTGPENRPVDFDSSFLEDHKKFALSALCDMIDRGYRGPVGVDALVYREVSTGLPKLYPIVEINARRTMSSAALHFYNRRFPLTPTTFSFTSDSSLLSSLLPSRFLKKDGTEIRFPRRLTISTKRSKLRATL